MSQTKRLGLYTKVCRRCGIFFQTTKRTSKVCDKCKKPLGGWSR